MSKVSGEVIYPDSSTSTYLRDDGTFATPSGTGAPASAQYVTLALDATLTSERTLAAQTGATTVTDGGAGANVTVGIVPVIKAGSKLYAYYNCGGL